MLKRISLIIIVSILVMLMGKLAIGEYLPVYWVSGKIQPPEAINPNNLEVRLYLKGAIFDHYADQFILDTSGPAGTSKLDSNYMISASEFLLQFSPAGDPLEGLPQIFTFEAFVKPFEQNGSWYEAKPVTVEAFVSQGYVEAEDIILSPAAPPEISGIFPPKDYATNEAPSVVINYSDALSGIAKDSFLFSFDGENKLGSSNFDQTALTYSPANLSEGQHSASFQVSDYAGQITKESWSFIYDKTKPAISHEPPANFTKNQALNVTVEIVDPYLKTVSFFQKPDSAQDFGEIEIKPSGEPNIFGATIPAELLNEGKMQYYFKANDIAGNSNQSILYALLSQDTGEKQAGISLSCFMEGFYNTDTKQQVETKLEVEARIDPTGANKVFQATTIVDTTILELDAAGKGSAYFENLENGSYFLVLKHKLPGFDAGPNHLPVITKDQQSLTKGEILNLDFAVLDNNPAYAPDGKASAMASREGVMVMRGANADAENADGKINRINGYDILLLQNNWKKANPDPRADFNGDGAVNGNDMLILLNEWKKESYAPLGQ